MLNLEQAVEATARLNATLDSKYEKISGQIGWKHNPKKGFVTWLELLD